jgi:hypothetical protein
MPVPPPTAPIKAAATAIFMLLVTLLGLSCSPAEPEVDQAALYTPESLAGELAYRFRQLNPDARSAAVRYKRNPKDEKDLQERRERSEPAKNKTSGGAPARKKQTGPPTLDDLLADIDGELDTIRGVSRPDACKKMIETISADATLPDGDKQRLKELVAKLEGSQ